MTTPRDTRSAVNDSLRWLVLLVCILLLLGLIAYARGTRHYHGDDVGSHGVRVVVVTPR